MIGAKDHVKAHRSMQFAILGLVQATFPPASSAAEAFDLVLRSRVRVIVLIADASDVGHAAMRAHEKGMAARSLFVLLIVSSVR